jgi:hypothetical protein
MKRTAILLTTSFLAVLVHAQAAPNLTGEWKMNIAKTDYGPLPAPEIFTRTITHNDPSLEYKTTQKGPQGEINTEIKYTTDGKPCVNKVQDSDAKGTANRKHARFSRDADRIQRNLGPFRWRQDAHHQQSHHRSRPGRVRFEAGSGKAVNNLRRLFE